MLSSDLFCADIGENLNSFCLLYFAIRLISGAVVTASDIHRNKRLSEAVVAYQHLILMQDPAMSSFISLIVTIQLT